MHELILNIGLARRGRPNLLPRQVRRVLWHNRISVVRSVVKQSATEPTLVCAVLLPAAPDTRHAAAEGDLAAVYRAAVDLEQEAIAVFDPVLNEGILVGPQATAWGDFNPAFFLNLS